MTHLLIAELAAARIASLHREAEQQRRVQAARRTATRAPRGGRFQRRT
jgi:hypothetical protein